MSALGRARLPWVVWGLAMTLLAPTLVLVAINGTGLVEIPSSVAMVVGYSTAGGILASRNPGNPIGWLMMTTGVSYLVLGFTDEYLTYTFETNPGAFPRGDVAALLNDTLWIPMMFGILLLLALFPTGRVARRRWRFLPWAIVALGIVAFVGGLLAPGPFDELNVDARITNPLGVEALGPVIDAVFSVWWIGFAAAFALSSASLVLRYRRSLGEERQQIRWLAYVAGTVAVVIVAWIVTGITWGSPEGSLVDDLFWLAVVTLLGVGVPVATGIAVLRYRLYDLDLVVKKTVLYATVAVLLTAVFVVVALVIGGLAGRTTTGAVVAAGAIGLLFWPAVRLAHRVADRVVYGKRATPYEVLSEFSGRVGGSYGDEDVLPRMAQILADAVGATRATVWLRVGNAFRPAAVSPAGVVPGPVRPSGDELPPLEGDTAVEVRDRGELLGALAVSMPANDPINPPRERLIRDLASQAGLVLRNVRLIEELRESRRRIVAAVDEGRRQLERNIHDGAQQQLVALAVKLRLADAAVGRDPAAARELLGQLQREANDTLENLRDVARGIYPPLLADKGLAAAVRAQAGKSPMPVEVRADGIGRYPPEVEAAVYFSVLEALQNAAKHAEGRPVEVRLSASEGSLRFEIEDSGPGFDPATTPRGSGLQNIDDRAAALGGAVTIRSTLGTGTTVSGWLPVGTE